MKSQSPQVGLENVEDEEIQQSHRSDRDSDMLDETKKEQKADDNAESSSTGSDGGKGGGSGGSGAGYSADCSSSDASSLEATKGNLPEEEMKRLSVDDGDVHKDKKETKPVKQLKKRASKSNKTDRRSKHQMELEKILESDQDQFGKSIGEKSKNAEDSNSDSYSVPQWNGVRIRHPMDPRIDLSTVRHIRTSSLSTAFPSNVNIPSQNNLALGNSKEAPTNKDEPPSIDQYMKLLEVVRPFFQSQGISQEVAKPTLDEPSERPSSNTSEDQKASADDKNEEKRTEASTKANDMTSVSHPNRDHDSDSSSMVVLARRKRKHLKKKNEDPTNDGSTNSTNDGSNSSSSDRNLYVEQPQYADGLQERKPEGNANYGDANEDEAGQESPQGDSGDRQESLSSSSSEGRNNPDEPHVAPLRFGATAVVSEYSTSLVGSSGASNRNMSTSGSGSGGNTGSGTGSGSNQGGSSGSGNDQGLLSSNGNGSSGSGNDVKGSSEETLDNSGENNSGGNSDGSNSNDKKSMNHASTSVETAHLNLGHRHAMNISETNEKGQLQKTSGEEQNAAREKKLQDKKRKRMNMRREYEEKVQQEMESSEGSHDQEQNIIKAGRPVTLDKVLSITNVARIVIKSVPPFLVVHTNAAYCRLSGIDSHAAVGKPISNLLSLPDQQMLVEAESNHDTSSFVNSKIAGYDEERSKNQSATGQDPSLNHIAAEAAGRARAAASTEDYNEMNLERLVSASGFGKCHLVNAIAKPHQLLGRNVAVSKPPSVAKKQSREEGGSNGSSVSSSYEGLYHYLPCNMSVAPVVSSPEAFNVTVIADKNQDNSHHKVKRRKHHYHSDSNQQTMIGNHQNRRIYVMREASNNRKRPLITHYVIQLESHDGTLQKFGGLGSQSSMSTTAEAKNDDISKAEFTKTKSRRSEKKAPSESPNRGTGNDEAVVTMESKPTELRESTKAIG